ncbi:hypothetical protein [Gimesia fumaroli]|uniref:Uncharacterized protein n=1 Tax=Gimesia fumaroli TaxID=2527976 RepID=A0A518I7I2_9PLAN|nr:hypothetical protein [Gimesia fumaroli]QDV49030.1 hypothetical protein Enr17x_10450 [Gimesia fumaroli]
MSVSFQKSGWFIRGIIVFCLTLMVFVAGVLIQGADFGGSASGRLANGRSVQARSDAWSLQTRFSGDTAMIDTAGYKIVVAPQELKVDGKPVAKIDAEVKAVDVNVQGGTVTFLANGKSVGTYRR